MEVIKLPRKRKLRRLLKIEMALKEANMTPVIPTAVVIISGWISAIACMAGPTRKPMEKA